MRSRILIPALLALVGACGKDAATNPDDDDNCVTLSNGSFCGTVNGGAYAPTSSALAYSGGLFTFGVLDAQGRGLAIVAFATETGTVTIALGTPSDASFTEGTSEWRAGGGGTSGNGTITFTTLTPGRVAANFSFTLQPAPGTATTGTRVVSGSFNLTTTE